MKSPLMLHQNLELFVIESKIMSSQKKKKSDKSKFVQKILYLNTCNKSSG